MESESLPLRRAMATLSKIEIIDLMYAALALWTLYHAVRGLYLLYLSPLAIYPGSPWAALSE